MSENFKVEEMSGFRVIHCLVDLTDEALVELVTLINDIVNSSSSPKAVPSLVLDLQNKSLNDLKFFRAITPVGMQLKKQSRKLHVVSTTENFEGTVRAHGMDGILRVFPKLSDLVGGQRTESSRPASVGLKADAAFLNAFIDAAIKTLQTQCTVTIVAQAPSIKGKILDTPYDIAGVIGLHSKAFRGSIAICYPKATFLALIGSMLGEKYTEITQDLEDGAAELLNIIFGQAKVELNEKKYEIEKAIPTIIRGEALKINHLGAQPTIVIPFESNVGPLRIEINIEAQELRKAA